MGCNSAAWNGARFPPHRAGASSTRMRTTPGRGPSGCQEQPSRRDNAVNIMPTEIETKANQFERERDAAARVTELESVD
jgi:hypothetical protein